MKLKTLTELFPRIKNDFADFAFIECTIAFCSLAKVDNPINQASRMSDATENVLSLDCKRLFFFFFQKNKTNVRNELDSPNKSNAGGNIARAGHIPKSREMFLL